MNLLSQLNEASSASPSELKDLLKKDPRTKVIFTRSFDSSSVDVPQLYATLKYYFLNNPEILKFAEKRGGTRNFGPWDLGVLRKIDPKKATVENLEDAVGLVKGFFKDYGVLEKRNIDKDTLEIIYTATTRDSRAVALPSYAQRELAMMPDIRQDAPLRLYMGINFQSRDFNDVVSYISNVAATTEGSAVKFLKSIRDGKRIVDMEFDMPTFWTSSLEQAKKYARHEYLEGRYVRDQDKMDGQLGFVISVLARPKDVLIDLGKAIEDDVIVLSSSQNKKSILAPGKYTCRLVAKYTPEGEVDLDAEQTDDSAIVVENLYRQSKFILKLISARLKGFTTSYSVMGKLNFVKDGKLLDAGSRSKIANLFDGVATFMNDDIIPLNAKQHFGSISPSDAKFLAAIEELKERIDLDMSAKIAQPRVKGTPQTHKSIFSLSGEDAIKDTTIYPLKDFFYYALGDQRFTDWGVGSDLNVALAFSNQDQVNRAHLLSKAAQRVHLDRAIVGLLSQFSLPVDPKDPKGSLQKVYPELLLALKAVTICRLLKQIEELIESALDAKTK